MNPSKSLGSNFLLVLVFACIAAIAVPAIAQERSGSLNGVVTDQSGGVLPGVKVTITNSGTNRSYSALTGSDGAYSVRSLEPGRYNVTFDLSRFNKAESKDINVLVGQTLKLDARLQVAGQATSVTVIEAAPILDTQSSLIAHNVTAEELDRIPKARSFQGVSLAAPGVNQGDVEGGTQVNGASAAENAYLIDGVPTNSILEGQSRQNTVFEYLQEVQVKTSGIDAEYGGALGGVISAITKAGGNSFHGEAHYYYLGSALSAGPVQRIQLSPVDNTTVFHLQDAKQANNNNEIGGSIGGPIVKDRLFFYGSVSPRLTRRTNYYIFSNGTEPGSLRKKATNWQGFGKVSFQSNRLRANVSMLATPTRDMGKLPAYNGLGTNLVVGSRDSFRFNPTTGFHQDQYNVKGDVDLTLRQSSILSLHGGYFSDRYKDVGIPTTTSYTYQTTSVGAANIPAALQGPINTQNLPRTLINNDLAQSYYGQADYSMSFSAGGTHLVKGGAGLRRSINDVNDVYPGGYVFIFWNTSVANFNGTSRGTGTYGYYQVNDFGTKGKVGANIASLYVQDSWTIGRRLTLNFGVRSENERIPTFRPDIQKYAFKFGFKDKVAPRLGAAFDLLGDGKVKLYGGWGRYFDWTKYELARGSFGGDFWHRFYRSLDTTDLGSLNLSNMPGTDLWGSPGGFRDLRGTQIGATDPNVKPMYQDSMNAGVDYRLNNSTVLGARYLHSNLKRTIEDFSALVNGDNIYRIGNPGEGSSIIYPASYPATADFSMPKPKRQYDALELTMTRRFAHNWFLNANYTYSRLYGNYAGLSDSDEISTPTTGVSSGTAQQAAGSIARPGSNASSAWDTDTLLWDSTGHLNVLGRLATDRPHVIKLYGSYAFRQGTQVGAFFYGGSGTPVTTQVNSIDQEGLMVNGRGDMGRTPSLTRTDLLISHEVKIAEGQKMRFEFNFINVFNQKTATHIFNFLNKGAPGQSSTLPQDAIDMSKVNLAQGYNYNALILATAEGKNAYDPRYGQADLWNPGLSGQFSVKWVF